MADGKRIRSCSRCRRRSGSGRGAARCHRLTFRCCQIGTECLPRLGAVTRYEDAVVTDVQRLWIEGSVKTFPEITGLGVQVSVRAEIWRDVAPLSGREIDLDQTISLPQAVADAIHRCGLERIGHDRAEL